MDERAYLHLADKTFKRLLDGLDDVDPEDVDVDTAGDVITFVLRGGKKCVVNTQRPVKQIWLAGASRAWHFSWDEVSAQWLDDKGSGDELFATIARLIADGTGIKLSF